jgi:hypothetical protein
MSLRTRERRFLDRDMPTELEVRNARGSMLIGASGRKYVDLMRGWCLGNLGGSVTKETGHPCTFDSREVKPVGFGTGLTGLRDLLTAV